MAERRSDLDEISRILGGVESELRSLKERAAEDRSIGDRRHADNLRSGACAEAKRANADAENKRAVQEIKEIVEPLKDTVAAMQPIVAAMQISRWKRTGAIGVAVSVLAFIGWVLEILLHQLALWIAGRFH